MSHGEVGDSQAQAAQARHLHAYLKTAILFGAVVAGTAITVAALIRRHRVSAAAARDALTTLEDEGLVGRGTADSAVVTGPALHHPDINRLPDR